MMQLQNSLMNVLSAKNRQDAMQDSVGMLPSYQSGGQVDAPDATTTEMQMMQMQAEQGVMEGAEEDPNASLEEYINALMMERDATHTQTCLLYTSPSPRDGLLSRMPSSA